LQVASAGESQEATSDSCAARYGFGYRVREAADALRILRPTLDQGRRALCRLKDIVEIVCDTPSKLA
jgi:hypothetical protein